MSALIKYEGDFDELPLVLLTLGGGEDGGKFLDLYCKVLATNESNPKFKSLVVTGPFLPQAHYKKIAETILPIKTANVTKNPV